MKGMENNHALSSVLNRLIILAIWFSNTHIHKCKKTKNKNQRHTDKRLEENIPKC